jgi:hypothetical protein
MRKFGVRARRALLGIGVGLLIGLPRTPAAAPGGLLRSAPRH